MSYPNQRDVIVIHDSDQDSSQPQLECVSGTPYPSGSGHPRRGKSEPMPCHWHSGLLSHDEAPTRRRSTRSMPYEVIDVDSDEASLVDRPPPKRARVEPLAPLPSKGDDNGVWCQELVANRRAVTRPIPKVVHGSAVESRSIVPPRPDCKEFTWVTSRRIALRKKHEKGASLPVRRKQSQLSVNPLVTLELSPVTACFRLAGGAVNKIIQKPGCIVISSATLGGQRNDPGATVQLQDYNRDGTLQIWQHGDLKDQSVILHGHCDIESPRQSETLEPACLKCYTVNDISFDPNQSHLIASTGHNGTVQLWDNGEKLDGGCYKYPNVPHDVAYRKKDSLMAVTCMNGCVYVHHTQSSYPLGEPTELRVAPPEAQHSVGAIVWGHSASADTLFASSESHSMSDFGGYHVAFDPDQGRRAYEFNATESGDAMALDPDGARLALCTAACDGEHHLRLYDVRRKDGRRPQENVRLDAFYAGPAGSSRYEAREGEVKAVSFSPDGVLLAVARSDDELHVYDSRFMGRSREPMRRFLHWGEDRCLGEERWGIVDAVWADGWCGRGLGVITGGSDGCVRFWDVRRSDDDISNGEVLARPDSDIGHFSVGDPYSGEMPLVIGDNGGRIYVYDHATACDPTR
ncbi:WD40-repeat-containing domain protein [Russula earlei]|uniref:WD40-repeat-containing domain protein n=1 Tax=Russula earlei TaxID=71964 RepID=A0ACC0UNL3_9AGAM|nr:WD40-repeat-containing domain protein [Russula earlei]